MQVWRGPRALATQAPTWSVRCARSPPFPLQHQTSQRLSAVTGPRLAAAEQEAPQKAGQKLEVGHPMKVKLNEAISLSRPLLPMLMLLLCRTSEPEPQKMGTGCCFERSCLTETPPPLVRHKT